MSAPSRFALLASLGCVLVPLVVSAADAPVPVPSGVVVSHQQPPIGSDAALAASFPDKYAWKLFLSIVQKAPQQVPVGNGLATNDAIWETWPDDAWTFPTNPDPAHPPQWPSGTAKPAKRLAKGFAAHGLAKAKTSAAKPGVGPDVPDSGGEEVRRNRATFEYVVKNNLWFQEGLQAFFQRAAASSNLVQFASNSLNFPIDAIEVKGNWVPILESQKSQYHWNRNADGQILGLVAMHITSKALPNWFWCTFEWTGNPGRGDYIGIHDSFGLKQPHTPSNTDQLNQVYPAGDLTPELLAQFKAAGLEGEWADEWQHYRLKGSQIDFTDATGRPLVLGNSVTEAGFVPTASCITCHARAAVTSAGANAFPLFGEKATLPLVNVPQQGAVSDQSTTYLTYNGTPDPAWYFNFSGGPSAVANQAGQMGVGTRLVNLPADFVWAIPFHAHPVSKK